MPPLVEECVTYNFTIFFFFETGIHTVAQASLKLTTILSTFGDLGWQLCTLMTGSVAEALRALM